MARKQIHIPLREYPEVERRLAEHFGRLLAASAENIAAQAVRLYIEAIAVEKYNSQLKLF